MSRYIIIGAGGVGGTVAAQLYEAGTDVVVVARGAHLDALRAGGLRYIRPDGERRLRLHAVGGPEEIALRRDDVLVVAAKSQDTEAIVQQWAWQPVRADGAAETASAAEALPIVLLQNGMENARFALRRFATVLDVVVVLPGTHLTPGEGLAPGSPAPGAFYLGYAPQGEHPAAHAVADDLRAAGFLVQVVADIERWKAAKLVLNVAHHIDSLYRPGPLRRAASEALREESVRVLAASGVVPADFETEGRIPSDGAAPHPVPGHDRGGSSAWQSLARAGSVEADYISGEIVLRARLAGVPAPLSTGVQQRIARLAREGGRPGSLGDADLRDLLGTAGVPLPQEAADAARTG